MKRIVALLLCFVTVLSLCACGAAEKEPPTGLEIGYARELIMPDRAVPLAGYGHTERRITSNFLDYLYATCIAGMSFITGPFEMFAATGVYIKENSPYDMTFICSCANDTYSYIPTIEAHDYGCYESYVCYFARGTAELLQVKYVEMLEGLK